MLMTCCTCPICPIYSDRVFMLYSNQGLLEWFLWHVTLCLTEPYDMFMMCSWYVHVCWMVLSWLDMFVTCCACIIWPTDSDLSNQRMLEWFLWHKRDRHFYSFGDMCSLPSHLCHSSCYVHVALSCLVIFLCVCDMLCMYYLLTVQYLGLFLFFQPAVVGMVIIAFYWFGAVVVNHPISAWWIIGFGKFVHVYVVVSTAFPCNVILKTNN